ncbi:protein FAM81A-like [Lytechinus variegatus]|uniref:protein FAM81A-like n=1 Tax=Lytechinus variegatus TaxID=7654 RepID=UPI001BB1AE65|nr:protein FAM81A-like [Lytechinus variegatus]XP_041464710.1 protein FAM81A-like [Lytechinus variegatus]
MASRLPPLQGNWGNVPRPHEGIQDSPSRSNSRNSRMLIERASELKDAIVSRMVEDDGYHDMWHDRHMRALLQEHLHAVTSAVKTLGHDIESLENQLSGRDQASVMSNTMMRSLEVQQATSVNDLRSRVARCDANISVLSGDMRKMYDSLSTLTMQMQTVIANQSRTEKILEEKISKLGENSEQHKSDYSARLQSSEDKFQQALSILDVKLKNLIEETNETVETIRSQGLSSQVKLEKDMTFSLESARSKRDKRMDEMEESYKKKMGAVEKQLEKLETEQQDTKSHVASELKNMRREFEDTLQAEQVRLERKLRALIEQFRKENTEGLKSLSESLTSLRAVLEGKQTLIAEEIRGEMANMKKLVVVT